MFQQSAASALMDSLSRPTSSSSTPSSTTLFDVFLRLRPPPPSATASESFLDLEDIPENGSSHHTHVTIKPPVSDNRKRAIERFGFTRVFEDGSSQKDVFEGIGLANTISGVLGSGNSTSRDALIATLGVTGSGKSHTMLGTKSQRGLTQMSLDVLFKSIGSNVVDPKFVLHDLAAVDVAESHLVSAEGFLEGVYGDVFDTWGSSRAQTPMKVSTFSTTNRSGIASLYRQNLPFSSTTIRGNERHKTMQESLTSSIKPIGTIASICKSFTKIRISPVKDMNHSNIYHTANPSPAPHMYGSRRPAAPSVSKLPSLPNIDNFLVSSDSNTEYIIAISMYEVYNDRIFDLLTGTAPVKHTTKDTKRRALLFKNTEYSPDRKVVAGLKKVVCGSFEQALMVLETGLNERRVAGTGSNAASSRSHGFFCVDVKKRRQGARHKWEGSTLTIVDLAGSERARAAKTAGSTLAEAGKINESLMYLGQCMQMQSDNSGLNQPMPSADNAQGPAPLTNFAKPGIVPFRQCKLTELLFSNSFHPNRPHVHYYPQQKATMIVTADPHGDFNATSQILRYSALAREVTVPRIPSVSQSIIYPSLSKYQSGDGRTSPSDSHTNSAVESEEVARLQAELSIVRLQLEDECSRRRDAESSWAAASTAMEQAVEEAEAAVRAECMDAFEARLAQERSRWMAAAEEERLQVEQHMDSKVGILSRTHHATSGTSTGEINIWEDSLRDRCTQLEHENSDLLDQVRSLESEVRRARNEGANGPRTPSRKLKSLKSKPWVADDENSLALGMTGGESDV